MKSCYIENIIIEAIEKNIDIKIMDKNENLFGNKYLIDPVDMVYIITDIEKSINQSISAIFERNDSEIMTINNLAKAIEENENTKNNVMHI